MEDYVPFNLAKKLNDKGFREKCLAYYDVDDNVGLLYNTQYTDEILPCQYEDLLQCHNTGEAETQSDDSGNCVDAPTISQVLKWLRVGKKIYLYIDVDDKGWFFEIKFLKTHKVLNPNLIGRYNSYEQAALAGIKYILDNLI